MDGRRRALGRQGDFRAAAAFVGLCTLALAAGCGNEAGPQAGPPEVTVATPLARKVTDWDEYTGRLAAPETVEMRARVSGYLSAAPFTEGALVKKGELLFVIDPRPYRAALDEARAELTGARARLELAERDLVRAQQLFDARTISERDLDTREEERKAAAAAIDVARARVQAAELDLEFSEVRAPIAGRVGRKLVTVGNLVTGGTEDATLLTTIVSVDPIHVYVNADEGAYLRYQRLAQAGERPSSRETPNPVRLQLADEQGFPHEGHMDFVDNRLDPATGTIQGRAVFPNPDGVLTPGLFARVQLIGEGPYDALLVPDQAIGTDQAQRVVHVVGDDAVVRAVPVVLGRQEGALRVIRSGLKPDDRVIINGLQRARPGAVVKPVAGQIG
jgi:RND family efflux transporter MFP subunit